MNIVIFKSQVLSDFPCPSNQIQVIAAQLLHLVSIPLGLPSSCDQSNHRTLTRITYRLNSSRTSYSLATANSTRNSYRVVRSQFLSDFPLPRNIPISSIAIMSSCLNSSRTSLPLPTIYNFGGMIVLDLSQFLSDFPPLATSKC